MSKAFRPAVPAAVPAAESVAPPVATGGFAAPPAHAPRDASQPVDAATIAHQQQIAAAHAGQISPVAQAMIDGVRVSELAAEPQPASADTHVAGGGLASAEPIADPLPLNPQDDAVTARPLRGQPKPIADPDLQITGGFAVPGAEDIPGATLPAGGSGIGLGESMYFPLDGTEVRELILSLFDELATSLQRDLRFTMAVTYPLCHVAVDLMVMTDQPDRTFVIHWESNEASGRPPDLVRQQLGLELPQKQMVPSPGGSLIVDRIR